MLYPEASMVNMMETSLAEAMVRWLCLKLFRNYHKMYKNKLFCSLPLFALNKDSCHSLFVDVIKSLNSNMNKLKNINLVVGPINFTVHSAFLITVYN